MPSLFGPFSLTLPGLCHGDFERASRPKLRAIVLSASFIHWSKYGWTDLKWSALADDFRTLFQGTCLPDMQLLAQDPIRGISGQ
jgi:hypothetical protein